MAIPLTKKQRGVLEAIRSFVQENGYSPSVRQLGGLLELSPATVQQHLDALQAKGYISRTGSAYGVMLGGDLPGDEAAFSIPVIGAIAAGEPILAMEDVDDRVTVPRALTGFGEYFALKVQGDSMIDDHIVDGDIVVVRRQESAENGEVVVALLEDDTATLKRIYRESGRIRLQPANSEMGPIYVNSLRIRGKVTGIVRQHV